MKKLEVAENIAGAVGTPGHNVILAPDDLILITGASGFIGRSLVRSLLERGFGNLRCFARPSSRLDEIEALPGRWRPGARIEMVRGNLLSPADCEVATKDVVLVFHLAAGRGEKSFPDAFMNSVVTTRNLLEASCRQASLRRFVNVSSFSVYTNKGKVRGRLLDEACPVESQPVLRGDAYCFAKSKQDEIVAEYGKRLGLKFVIMRPGYVYGPGKSAITGRVGIGTFGVFLHLGGSNPIPFTYVDNCADAIALGGLRTGIEGEVFNIVDDDLPTSRQFLSQYRRRVRRFTSVSLPHWLSFVLCYGWERYSAWSEGQLEPIYNRATWHAYWKKSRYSNEKAKQRLGWSPRVSMAEGLKRYFQACESARADA